MARVATIFNNDGTGVRGNMRAVVEASQWNDKLENRPKMAEVVSQPQYINCPKEIILGRLLGDYDYGDGRKADGDRGEHAHPSQAGAAHEQHADEDRDEDEELAVRREDCVRPVIGVSGYLAIAFAATGNSNAPGTLRTSMRVSASMFIC